MACSAGLPERGGTPSEYAAYADALEAHIEREGPCSLTALGEAVERPKTFKKLGLIIKDHAYLVTDAKGMVKLATSDTAALQGAALVLVGLNLVT